MSPRRSTQGKISQRHRFIRIIQLFWRSNWGCENCIFAWKTIWMDTFDWIWGNISLRAIFPVSSFLRLGRKYTTEKPHRTSVNVNSSKVRRNNSPQKRWENYAKCRKSQTYLHLNRQSWHDTQYSKFNNNWRGKGFEDIKNQV